MEILINEKKIDFKLENEKVLRDVVNGLISWAEQDGYHLQQIMFDGKPYNSDSEEAVNTPIESVSVLDITAKTMFELHQDNLQLLNQYVSLFLKSIEGNNIKLIRDLQAEAGAVSLLIADFLQEPRNSAASVSSSLLQNIKALDPDNIDTDNEKYKALIQQLSGLKIIINERVSELGDPLGELARTTSALKITQQELNDISVLLQTGKDREALGCIIRFSELNQKTLRLYPILKNEGFFDINNLEIDGMPFSDFYRDFNVILSELIEAFTANDSVLIGDLLEYEIAPRLENLLDLLERVLKENMK